MSATTHVINPLTGRQIKVGGAMYRKLVREGVIVNQPYELVVRESSGAEEKEPVVEVKKTKKKKVDSARDAQAARLRKKQEVLRKREILREKKKLQKALQRSSRRRRHSFLRSKRRS